MARKAFIRDLVVIPLVIVGSVLVIFFCYYVWDQFMSNLIIAGNITVSDPNSTLTSFSASVNASFNIFDVAIPVLVVALMVGSWVLAAFLPSNPLLFWVSVLAIIISIWFSIIPSNIFNNIITEIGIVLPTAKYPNCTWIALHLPLIVLVTAVGDSIALYKNKV